MKSGAKYMVAAALVAVAALGGCRGAPADKAELANLDDGLAAEDPVIKGALEDQILVDPKLVGQANQNAATPGNRPNDGASPAVGGTKLAADAEAAGRAAAGTLVAAPAPMAFEEGCADCAAERPATLGAMARDQGKCDAKLTYAADWANRLPAAFRVYPKALVREAAGVDGGKCNIRVVNFQTAASKQAVLDYYHTMATRAGYSSEHRLRGDEHYLGGTKGNQAFVIMLRRDGSMTDVDLVASGGR